MTGSEGLWMLVTVAAVLVATGLPAWIVLVGVALGFAAGGVATGALSMPLLTAMPARILGLLEHDLLQALPLYVLMGALLNQLPLAQTLFRAASRALAPVGANASLAGLGLGVLLAPMNGSVGASAAMLSRTVQPRLDQSGMTPATSAALVCVPSTMGVVVPPSLVLILLGDAMMRAHTEAVNITGAAIRIINTQDVFIGALVPAGILLAFCIGITWWNRRNKAPTSAVKPRDWLVASITALFIASLLAAVTLGYLYAVEAAAAGGVALFVYGLAIRSLTFDALRAVLLRHDGGHRRPVRIAGRGDDVHVDRARFRNRSLGRGAVAAVAGRQRRGDMRRVADSRAVRAGARRVRIDLRRRAGRGTTAAHRRAQCDLGRGAYAADPAGELPVAILRLRGSYGAKPIASTRTDGCADARAICPTWSRNWPCWR